MTIRVAHDVLDDGALWRVRFGQPPGNILDRATCEALAEVFQASRRAPGLKAVTIEGTGDHFSYGASIPEHAADAVAALLAAMEQLVLAVLESQLVVVAVVRGRCLGGGLELAALGHHLVASRDATFGQPEIALGVFAPVASILLAPRIGQAAAEDLCLTGRAVDASEAKRLGLANEVAEGDPWETALGWVRQHCTPRSATSLRYAVEAIRTPLLSRVRTELPNLNRLYLEGLMQTADAVEGVQAFLEKRPARWRNG